MSILNYPRIHFKGTCLVNPATGNNDDVSINIDTVNVALQPGLAARSDADIRAWMMSGVEAISPINNQKFWYLRSAWNYFGNMSVTFSNAAVTAVVGRDGKTSTSDSIIGQTIELLGTAPALAAQSNLGVPIVSSPAVICDLDPLGTSLTQIFIGGLSLGDGRIGFSATFDTRAFARWVLWRNVGTYQGEQNFPAQELSGNSRFPALPWCSTHPRHRRCSATYRMSSRRIRESLSSFVSTWSSRASTMCSSSRSSRKSNTNEIRPKRSWWEQSAFGSTASL